MKEEPGVSKAQAWGCHMHTQEIFNETQASKLGDAPASRSPSTIISSSFSTLYFYHFMCYVLCLESLAITFQFCLVQFSQFSVHNKLDPSMPCLGEKHAPLLCRMRFTTIFDECSFLLLATIMFSSSSSCLSFKSFYLGCCFQNSLEFHAYLVYRAGPLH